MADLDDLLAKLEAAPKDTPELWSEIIVFAAGQGWIDIFGKARCTELHNHAFSPFHDDMNVLIAVALTLVPEGWDWIVSSRDTLVDQHPWAACWRGANDDTGRCWKHTPALALVIAALEARMQEADDG